MGFYINPSDMEKEDWLRIHGTRLKHEPTHEELPQYIETGNIPVCLVLNLMFTAAAVCVNSGELSAFTQEDDQRPKWWFTVPEASLVEIGALPPVWRKWI